MSRFGILEGNLALESNTTQFQKACHSLIEEREAR
jgi:hypothetical protein